MLSIVFVMTSFQVKWLGNILGKLSHIAIKLGSEFLFAVYNKIILKNIFFKRKKTGSGNNV